MRRMRATSAPSGTPPRGSASTTGSTKFFFARASASVRPAWTRFVKLLIPSFYQHVPLKPGSWQVDNLVQCARLFKQMSCSRNDLHVVAAAQKLLHPLVRVDNRMVVAGNSKRCLHTNLSQAFVHEIRSANSGNCRQNPFMFSNRAQYIEDHRIGIQLKADDPKDSLQSAFPCVQ